MPNEAAEMIRVFTLTLSAGRKSYTLFQDMVPKVHGERKWLPTFRSVLDFIIRFAFPNDWLTFIPSGAARKV